MNRRIIVVFVAVSLSACGTPSIQDLASSIEKSALIVSSTAQAIELVQAIPLIPNDRVEAAIELSDAAMRIGEAYGNFELFSLSSEFTTRYRIELRVLCECGAFQNHILNPIAYVVNSQGELANDTPISIEGENPRRGMPPIVLAVWEGKIGAGETLYFVVAADNRAAGERFGGSRQIMETPYFTLMPLSLRSYPTGEILVDLFLDEP